MNPWMLFFGEPECPCCGEPCEVDAPDDIHPEAWCEFCGIDALAPCTVSGCPTEGPLNAEGVCAACAEAMA